MKFVLTRHTTSEWNARGLVQGQTDINLSQKGENEAVALARNLSVFGITLIVTSDLKRARRTAEIIQSEIGVPVEIDNRLRECAYGNLEGTKNEDAAEKSGIKNWQNPFLEYDFRSFGGESYADVLSRHLSCLTSLKQKHPKETILIVGHGRGLWTLLRGLGYNPRLNLEECRTVDF